MKPLSTTLLLLMLITGGFRSEAQTGTEIDKACKSGKAVFLVAFNTPGPDTEKAISIAKDAAKKNASSFSVIELNSVNPANSNLITKFRLAGAPMPMILVVDRNGNPAGGLALKDATPEKLLSMVPSPKLSEIIKALAEGKSVYVVVYKESMTSKKNIIDNCYLACNKLENKSVIVKVDLEDKNEIKLIRNLRCNPDVSEPMTYVINPTGQVTGAYSGITDVDNLVSSAKKVASGGCCPGGSKTGGCK